MELVVVELEAMAIITIPITEEGMVIVIQFVRLQLARSSEIWQLPVLLNLENGADSVLMLLFIPLREIVGPELDSTISTSPASERVRIFSARDGRRNLMLLLMLTVVACVVSVTVPMVLVIMLDCGRL